MSDSAPDSLIPYDEIVQEALRAVVGRVLGEVEKEGLPGEHHFYITFKTRAPGVDIPDHLIAKFPDEMTIVLQNRYWDLSVQDDRFEVGLSFNSISSMLHIPFAAITSFVDPAVDFALQFQVEEVEGHLDEHEPAQNDGEAEQEPEAEDGSNVITLDFGKKK
ncbi:MAG: ClpXP protease specificity-enhancing factor SspB [Pseudomonadota bacterium]